MKATLRPALLWVTVTASCTAAGVLAQETTRPGPEGRGGPATAEAAGRTLAPKLRLLDTLVHRSPAVKRIEASDDSQAKGLVETAREAHARAQALYTQGAYGAAEAFVQQGLRAMGSASRRVEDPQRRRRSQAQRYQELRSRVLSFGAALKRVETAAGTQTVRLDHATVDQGLRQAEALARGQDYGAANRRLSALSDRLEGALSEALHQKTLIHELKFASPAEEYAYEKEHNRSQQLLIRLLGQRRAAAQAQAAYVQRCLERNEALRREAEALAAEGDDEAALRQLEKGTRILDQALRMSGVMIP